MKSWEAIVPDNDNRAMFPPLTMAALAGAAALAGCSPALDWPAVRLEAAPLKTLTVQATEPFFAGLRFE